MGTTRRLLLWLGAALSVGCGAQAPQTPMQRAVGASQRQLVAAVEAGEEEMARQPAFTLRARFNPPPPSGRAENCPAFEVRYSGRWHRVFLETEEENTRALELYREEGGEGARGPDLVFSGRPTGRFVPCEKGGQVFEVFALESIGL